MSEVDFNAVFKHIPLLQDLSPDDFEITALAGLTNQNFRLLQAEHDYLLRIPAVPTNRMINRQAEAFNVAQLRQLGLAPEPLWRDDHGLSLTRFITGARVLTAADLLNDSILSLLAGRIAVLHTAELKLHGQIDLLALLSRYFDMMPANCRAEYADAFEAARRIMSLSIQANDQRMVASHNDLVLDNLLIDDSGQLYFIDWEYAAMASPYWDLAIVCNSARLGPGCCRQLLHAYHQAAFALSFQHLRDYQWMLQVLTIGWMACFSPQALPAEIDWLHQLERKNV